ncbi:MAG: carbon storage regulator [Pseudomonadota bacterium]
MSLVLSRSVSERVVLQYGEEEIWVTVTKIDDKKCRLAFDASRAVVIHREEVFQAIKRQEDEGGDTEAA